VADGQVGTRLQHHAPEEWVAGHSEHAVRDIGFMNHCPHPGRRGIGSRKASHDKHAGEKLASSPLGA
jgi:hypothetical protein